MPNTTMRIICLAFLAAFLMPSYCFSAPKSLNELLISEPEGSDVKDKTLPVGSENIRFAAMRDAALTTGAQHGFVSRINALKLIIESKTAELDRIFDFNSIMKLSSTGENELFLLPPVIQEASDVVAISNNEQQLRVSGTIYTILSPARLVGLPPNWRTYLLLEDNVNVQDPFDALYPKTPDEVSRWNNWITEGWSAGIAQAELEMTYRARKLGREFNGMVKYMSLHAQGKVNEPVVVSSFQPVTGGGAQMRVEDQIYQVSLPAALQAEHEGWVPLMLDNRGDLLAPGERK